MRTGQDADRNRFVTGVSRLMNEESRTTDDISVWPTLSHTGEGGLDAGRWALSAGVQGAVASTLLRAGLLVGDRSYFQTARRALRALETEIFDGGVSSVVGANGLFFEDVAVYPAGHNLSGCLLGLLGLYEYHQWVDRAEVEPVIDRGMSTLHSLLDLYDTGFWTRVDLLGRRLGTVEQHAFHVSLLKTLASHSGCDHCITLSGRWARYQRGRGYQLRRNLAVLGSACTRTVAAAARQLLFPARDPGWSSASRYPVCISLPAFPVAGGTRAIVTSMSKVMANEWDVLYLTHQIGSRAGDLPIEQFGGRWASYWQFPNVWLYAWAGLRSLAGLVRRGVGFRVILPQDGSYTALFSAIIGKAVGVRVVSVEHGTLLFPYSRAYREERVAGLDAPVGVWRMVSRLRLALLWPCLRLMSRIAAGLSDLFLVQGDEIEEIYCRRLGVHPSRIVRFLPAIDSDFFQPLIGEARGHERARLGFSMQDVIIVMNGRLAPEKGFGIALAGLADAMATLPVEIQGRVRLIIAGEGPARKEVEATLRTCHLESISTLLGEAEPTAVATILGISDVFLYASVRGANTAVSVLEAMASGCAVVASERPPSHAKLLADGRGISIPAGDVSAVSSAVSRVLRDPYLRADLARSARDHILSHYSPGALKRALMRATYYTPISGGLS